ncbi:MAG: hypothetical protein ABSD97_02995 [Acidimicrobiales bacterium]
MAPFPQNRGAERPTGRKSSGQDDPEAMSPSLGICSIATPDRLQDGGTGAEGSSTLPQDRTDDKNKGVSRSRWSLWSEDSFLSIGSKGSVLSIGSIGSACSIGSIGSACSIGSIGSFFSAFSALSAGSVFSLLSAGSRFSALSAGSRSSASIDRSEEQPRLISN